VDRADVFAASFAERPLPVNPRTLDAARDAARLLLAMTEISEGRSAPKFLLRRTDQRVMLY
jgi:hypothetical protein